MLQPGQPALPDWSILPADILHNLAELLPREDVGRMLLTCWQWNYGVKAQMLALQPAYLGLVAGSTFSALRGITAPLHRVKCEGFIRFVAPLGPVTRLSQFTTLTHLNIAGQELDESSLTWIAQQLINLRHLDLSTCKFRGTQWTPLSSLFNLTELSFDGLVMSNPSAAESTQLLHSISNLPRLCSLNLNVRTYLRHVGPHGMGAFRQHFEGVVTLNAAYLLTRISSLTQLSLLNNKLSTLDAQHIGNCTRLRSLDVSCVPLEKREAAAGAGRPPAAPDVAVPPTSLLAHLCRLTNLRHLGLELHGSLPFLEAVSLAPLSSLTSLAATGCGNMYLLFSLMHLTNLQRLDLSLAQESIAHELIIQVVHSLSHLHTLHLNHLKWAAPISFWEFVGDALVRGIGAVAPQLRELQVDGVRMHGTGLHQHFGCFAQMTSMVFSASEMLRSKYFDVAQLHKLQQLVITGMTVSEFNHLCRLGCLTCLSALTNLTTLKILRSRGPGATLPDPPLHEPHLHFVSTLPSLQYLELGVLVSSGICFQHMGNMSNLKALHLDGRLDWTSAGVECVANSWLPSLTAVKLASCIWPGHQTPSTSAAHASTSSAPSPSTPSPPHMGQRFAPIAPHPFRPQVSPPQTPAQTPHINCNHLLAAMVHAMPNLMYLDVADCPSLSTEGISHVTHLRHLRYIRFHRQPLPWEEMRAAFSAATQVKYVEALGGRSPHIILSRATGPLAPVTWT